MQVPPNITQVIRKLNAAGYEGHVVGGAVRDAQIGRRPKDFDVTTDATPDEIMAVFPGRSLYTNRFGTVVVRTTLTTISLTTKDCAAPIGEPLDLRATIRSRHVPFKELMAGNWIDHHYPIEADPEGDAIIAWWERKLKAKPKSVSA